MTLLIQGQSCSFWFTSIFFLMRKNVLCSVACTTNVLQSQLMIIMTVACKTSLHRTLQSQLRLRLKANLARIINYDRSVHCKLKLTLWLCKYTKDHEILIVHATSYVVILSTLQVLASKVGTLIHPKFLSIFFFPIFWQLLTKVQTLTA